MCFVCATTDAEILYGSRDLAAPANAHDVHVRIEQTERELCDAKYLFFCVFHFLSSFKSRTSHIL